MTNYENCRQQKYFFLDGSLGKVIVTNYFFQEKSLYFSLKSLSAKVFFMMSR